jgi:hypothetical protein
MTRERMSEAGLLVAKPECQWRPGKGHPNRKCGVARNGICRQKAPWAWEAIVVGATVVEEVLVLEERPARVGGTERYDRGVCGQFTAFVKAHNADTDGGRETGPLTSGMVIVVVAGSRSVDCGAPRGRRRRQRSSGVVVDGPSNWPQ